MEGVSVGASLAFAFDADAAAALEQEQVDLGTLMCSPIIGFVRLQCLEHFFDGIAFPGGADFGMKLQISPVGDAQKRVQEAAVADKDLWRFDLSLA